MAEVHRDQRELLQEQGIAAQPDPAELAGLARQAGAIAIDTEFVSERRYQPLLCLVQAGVGTNGSVTTGIYDPLAGFDARPLAEVLADPAVEVLLHAGRQDVALLKRHWDTEVRNVFDTQIAAGFAGYGNQTSHADLVRSLLKITVPKSEGFTRWDTRPLTKEQIAYARADVEHLPAIARIFEERLGASGRLDWARQECRALEDATDERTPESAYRSVPRLGRLTAQQRAVAYELAQWRDETARELDRPPAAVMPDHVLWEVARRCPAERSALAQIRGMPERTLGRHHREIAEAIRRGQRAEPIPHEEKRLDVERADAPVVALAQALVRQRALEAEVAVEFIATQSDLARIVAGHRSGEDVSDVRPLFGWRRELVGQELLDLLDGRRAARVLEGRLRVEAL